MAILALPLWHADFLCFFEGFQDFPKSRVGQKCLRPFGGGGDLESGKS